jgi:hypothetical protein
VLHQFFGLAEEEHVGLAAATNTGQVIFSAIPPRRV